MERRIFIQIKTSEWIEATVDLPKKEFLRLDQYLSENQVTLANVKEIETQTTKSYYSIEDIKCINDWQGSHVIDHADEIIIDGLSYQSDEGQKELMCQVYELESQEEAEEILFDKSYNSVYFHLGGNHLPTALQKGIFQYGYSDPDVA